MSFWVELRRRNVVRVGIAYGVGAWLLLQFTEVLSELLSLPSTIGPVVVAVVALGLPVALFLAWAYELTPEGVKRESDVDRDVSITTTTGKKLNGLIMGLLAVAVVVLLVDKFLLRGAGEPAEPRMADAPATEQLTTPVTDAPAEVEVTIDPRSIAVLPFTNRSPVAEDEFFIDGIHDDLLTNLARIGELKVISRTSVLRFKETDTPIPEIAETLRVATIMEGAVQRAGDMVRINVQLIDAETDEHLWAQIYDRELTTQNLFSIQSEIAGHIAEALEARLSPEVEQQLESQPTDNLAAYSAYLRGLRGFARREIPTMKAALEEFQRAVELDPEFAHAWAGITMVATVLPSWGGLSEEDGKALAEPAAERAMALSPDLGESNLALAMVLEGEEAEAQYKKATDLLPGSAAAHQWYANQIQGDLERYDEAMALLRRAVELDPLSPIYRHQIARHYLFAGRFAEAEKELRKLLEVDPDFFAAVSFMSIVTAAQGRYDESVQWDQRSRAVDPYSPFPVFGQIAAFDTLRDADRLERLITTMRTTDDPLAETLLPIAEASLAILEGRYAAAIEQSMNMSDIPFALEADGVRAYVHAYARDYGAAREALQRIHPGFFDADTLEETLRDRHDNACFASFILLKTGDENLGETLLSQTIDYVRNELSNLTSDAEQWGQLHHCLAIAGDFEGSIDVFERGIARGNYRNWWDVQVLEYFDPLQGGPRFEAIVTRIETEMARQRASLDAWEAEQAGS